MHSQTLVLCNYSSKREDIEIVLFLIKREISYLDVNVGEWLLPELHSDKCVCSCEFIYVNTLVVLELLNFVCVIQWGSFTLYIIDKKIAGSIEIKDTIVYQDNFLFKLVF